MFLIFKRKGFLVPVLFILIGVLYVSFEQAVMGEATPENPGWGLWPVFVVTGLALWFLGRRMNADSKRIVIDTETGEEIALDRSHSFFFIKMQYWAIPMLILAAADLADGPPEYRERRGKKNQDAGAVQEPQAPEEDPAGQSEG